MEFEATKDYLRYSWEISNCDISYVEQRGNRLRSYQVKQRYNEYINKDLIMLQFKLYTSAPSLSPQQIITKKKTPNLRPGSSSLMGLYLFASLLRCNYQAPWICGENILPHTSQDQTVPIQLNTNNCSLLKPRVKIFVATNKQMIVYIIHFRTSDKYKLQISQVTKWRKSEYSANNSCIAVLWLDSGW